MTHKEQASAHDADLLLELEHIQLQILISQDMLDRDVRRLRWWVLTQTILLLALTIVVVHR